MIIDLEFTIDSTAYSVLISVCVPWTFVLSTAAGLTSNPPNITEARFLFIALHIIYDKIAPDDPTNAPTIVKSGLSSINPSAHKAHPEYEFKTVITTGISAPPIAFVKVTPNTLLAAVAVNKAANPTPKLPVVLNKYNEAMDNAAKPMFI